ncbi:MAG: PAS domain S-box protein [Candidatus Heimdallarchaeota archaeon]|nr:PAS domain S-box protein [Candidatus Heimdallarchaeota archaeon]
MEQQIQQLQEKCSLLEKRLTNLKRLVDSLNIGILLYDPILGLVSYFNQKFLEILGFTSNDLVNKHPLALIFPDQDISSVDLTEFKKEFKFQKGESQIWLSLQLISIDSQFAIIIEETTNQNVHETETRYQTLFENAPISIWEEDFSAAKEYLDELKGKTSNISSFLDNNPEELRNLASLVKVIDVNNISLDLYGADNKEKLLKGLNQIFDESAYHSFKEEILNLSEGKTEYEAEFTGIMLTGKSIISSIKLSVVPGYEESLSKVIVSVLDITERRKAEQELREVKNRLSSIVNQSSDGIILIDQEGRIREWNPAMERITGILQKDAIYKYSWTVQAALVPETSSISQIELVMERMTKELLREGKGSWFDSVHEYTIKALNGEFQILQDSPFLIPTENSFMIGSIIRDITNQKRFEQELIDREEKYRSIIEQLSDGLVLIDTTGNINEWNHASEQIFEYNREEVLGEKFWDIQHQIRDPNLRSREHLEKSKERILQAFSIERAPWLSKSFTSTIYLRSGEIKYIEQTPFFIKTSKDRLIGSITRDITELKTAELELVETKNRLMSIINQSYDGIALIDTDGKIIEWNRGQERITGYSKKDSLGHYYWDLNSKLSVDPILFAQRKDSLKQSVVMALREGNAEWLNTILEIKIKTKDEEIKHLQQIPFPIKSEKGFMIGSITRDITEMKKTELKLQQQTSFLENVMEMSPIGIVTINPDGKISFANKYAETVLGLTKNQITERTYNDPLWIITSINGGVFPEEELPVAKVLESKKPVRDVKHAIELATGERRLLSINATPIFDEQKQIKSIVATIFDITQASEFEKQLKESEEKFRILSEQSVLGICIIQDERIIYANQTVADTFGYSLDKIINNKFESSIHPDDRDFGLKKIHLGQFGAVTNYQIRMITKAEAVIWLDIYSRSIQYNAKPANMLAFIDITEKKRAIELLERSESRYRNLFETTPIPMRELDFSEALAYINQLKERGVEDIAVFFKNNPQKAIEVAKLVKDTDLNSATLELYNVNDLKEFRELRYKTWDIRQNQENLIAANNYLQLLTGKTVIEFPHISKIDGKRRYLLTKVIVVPGHEETLSRVLINHVDITKLKETEESIKESEIKFKKLFDNAPISTWLIDLSELKIVIEGIQFSDQIHPRFSSISDLLKLIKVLDINESSLKLFNALSKEELLNKYLILALEDFLGDFEKGIAAFFAGEDFFEAEGKTKTLDGKEISIFYRATMPSEFKDDWSFVILSIVDISDLKQTQQLLQESQAKYESILRVAPIGIGLVDENRNLTYLSKTLMQMLRYKEEELIGKNARILYPSDEEYQRIGREKYADIAKYGTGVIDTFFRRKDGTIIEIDLRSTPIDPTDPSKGVTFTALNITDRKLLEQRLRIERDRAQTYLDIAGVILIAIDKNMNISLINNKGCEVLEYLEDEIIGMNWFENFLPDDNISQIQDVFHKLMKGEFTAVEYVENIVKTKSGKLRCIAWHNTVIRNEFGEIIGTLSSGEDITLRKQAERDLKISEQRFRNIFESNPNAMILYELEADNSLIFQNANQMTDQILGIQSQEFIGKTIEEAFPGLIETEVPSMYRKVAKTGTKWVIDSFKYDSHGIKGIYAVTAFQTQPNQMAVSFRDITESKKAEEELKRSEERFRNIFNYSPFGMFLCELKENDELLFIGGNQTANEILGFDCNTLVGMTIEQAIPNLVSTQIPRMSRAVAKYGSKWSVDQLYYEDDYFKGFFEIHAFQAEKNRVVAAFRDITEKIISQRKLEESEERFRRLFVTLTEGIWVSDKNSVTTFVNPAIIHMLGYSETEMVGHKVDEFITEEYRPILYRANEMRHNMEDVTPYELGFIRKDGTQIITRVAGSILLDENNEFIGTVGIISDITSAKLAEEARNDLENRRADFIALTSHELRTPLTIIKGYYEIFKSRYDEIPPRRREHLFDVLEKNINRLETLITGVSEITKIERGIFILNTSVVEFKSFITKQMEPYQTLLGKQLQLVVKDFDRPALVEIDVDRMSQVLNNLMENAVHHSDKDNRRVVVECQIHNQNIRVNIRDNGAGILDEHISRLFDPFVSFPTKYSVRGTGIGLYLCKTIIEAHGGEISIFSEGLDKGTTVTIELPLQNF